MTWINHEVRLRFEEHQKPDGALRSCFPSLGLSLRIWEVKRLGEPRQQAITMFLSPRATGYPQVQVNETLFPSAFPLNTFVMGRDDDGGDDGDEGDDDTQQPF